MADFTPHLTPAEMLRRGVFGGSYFQKAMRPTIWHMLEGLPKDVRALVDANSGRFDKERNAYGVKAGQSYEQWMRNGWIFPEDPLGWFHWYCRYAAGRRHERDDHQIRRWHNYGTRWGMFARRQMHSTGDASLVVKQGLLQWAYEPMRVLHEMGDS